MSPRHHPNEEWLVNYAAGSLDEAHSILVASHLACCDVCRDKVRTAEEVGGALLEAEAPVGMEPGSLDEILAKLDVESAGRDIRSEAPAARDGLPGVLAEFIGCSLDCLRWKSLGGGIKAVRLDARGREDSRLWLLHGRPNALIEEHSHRGSELILVLKGGLIDRGQRLEVGDIGELADGESHAPVVTDEGECLCLVVTEAPLRFKGFLARMLQPLVGL